MSTLNYINKLSELYKTHLSNPFPYEDTNKIKAEFKGNFAQIDENLNADFSDYCSVIEGTITYILNANVEGIPERQVELIHKSFFERFEQYSFIEERLSYYPNLCNEYNVHEKARRLILDFLSSHNK